MKRIINFGVLLIVALFLSSCGYNSLQTQEETVFKAWADIEATLQRRADLIPNLVATVKGYAQHEQETLQKVVEARAKATSAARQQLPEPEIPAPRHTRAGRDAVCPASSLRGAGSKIT